MSVMDEEVRFAADPYRGTAAYYERYRLPYPQALIRDLARRAGVSGHWSGPRRPPRATPASGRP
jgi:hypothetical protein